MRGAERRRHEEHSPWQQLGRKERGRSGWDSRYTDPFVGTKNNFGPLLGVRHRGCGREQSQVPSLSTYIQMEETEKKLVNAQHKIR